MMVMSLYCLAWLGLGFNQTQSVWQSLPTNDHITTRIKVKLFRFVQRTAGLKSWRNQNRMWRTVLNGVKSMFHPLYIKISEKLMIYNSTVSFTYHPDMGGKHSAWSHGSGWERLLWNRVCCCLCAPTVTFYMYFLTSHNFCNAILHLQHSSQSAPKFVWLCTWLSA